MSFAPEDQLLLQCSRVRMSSEAITRASRLLEQELNWEYILETSIRHGVSPLFYWGLNQVSQVVALDNFVPAWVMDELQNLYQGNRSRNCRLYRVIGEIATAFEQAGIQVMGLKEVQLAREVYQDIGLRPMGDIDVLIRPEDYEKAATQLVALGFFPLPDSDIPFTLKYAWALHFRRPTDNVWIDVQWNVIQIEWDVYQEGNFDFEIARMWRGARVMSLDDYRMLVPSPEDMLFHLCLHLEGHAYSELILFCDIAELLRCYDDQLDWEYFIGITKKYGAESSVYYVLFQVQQLFDAPLPAFLLRELAPAYFKANIFRPLFDNLTVLHLALDEIRLASFPPDSTMRKFESTVRRQAAGAMQLFKEIDNLASAFISSGGSVIILDGASSQKIFPDPGLRSFEEFHFLVLHDDLPRMRQVLTSSGFAPKEAHSADAYFKNWEFGSMDTAISGQPTSLTLQVDIEQAFDHLPHPENGTHTSKKDLALRVLRAKLGGREHDEAIIPARIKLVALSPEDMLMYLSARLGQEEQYRLFGLCSLLDFLRSDTVSVDWHQVAEAARQRDASGEVCKGLLMVREFLDDGTVPQSAVRMLDCPGSPPRVLEWARYGPDSLVLYTGFKRIFFYFLTFLSIDGTKAKWDFFLGSLIGARGNKPVLPGLIRELVANMFSLPKSRQHTARDFAYWIEPGPVSES